MVREAEQFKADDEKIREGQKARNELEGLLFGVKSQVDGQGENKLPVTEEDKKVILDLVSKQI